MDEQKADFSDSIEKNEEIRAIKKVEKKLRKTRTNFGKQKFLEIRKKIIESLNSYPKNIYELSRDVGSNSTTTEKHLFYLTEIGVVVQNKIKISGRDRVLYFLTRR